MPEITGILDQSTQQVVVLTDDRITLRGNVKIHGVLDVGLVKTTEIISDHRFEKKYLTFVAPEEGSLPGTGLLWIDKTQNKELTYRPDPDRFFLSEHIDLPSDKAYLIGGSPILTVSTLGSTVVHSNIQRLGQLKDLRVAGHVNFADTVFFNADSRRFSLGSDDLNGLFSVYDEINDVEIVLDSTEEGHAKIGTFNNKSLNLVTGNSVRIAIDLNGTVTIGTENAKSSSLKVYGRLGINVKNPKEDLEVQGNMKFSNKLFATGLGAPTEGSYQKGDIVWNENPVINGYIGWVCISGGLPGLWQPFGLIAG